MKRAELEKQGELAMRIISSDPLYASTSGITYEEAIAIAEILTGGESLQSYVDEMDRIESMSFEELEKEPKQQGAIK